jgi:hypothetical protein
MNWGNFDTSKLISHPKKMLEKFNFTKLFENCENSFAHTHTRTITSFCSNPFFLLSHFVLNFTKYSKTKFLNEKFLFFPYFAIMCLEL